MRKNLVGIVLGSVLSGGCFKGLNLEDPNSADSSDSTPSTPSTQNTNGSNGSATRTVTLYAEEDADVSSLNVRSNFGYQNTIRTGIVNFGPSREDRYTGFVKFNFLSIPKGATIIDAKLILTTAINNTNTKPEGNVTLSSVTDTYWTESGLNWANSPSRVSYISSKDVKFDIQAPVEFNVGNIVSGWVSGSSTNEGFMIQTRSFDNVPQSSASFYSNELDRNLGPRLQIVYIN